MSTPSAPSGQLSANAEATAAWDGPLYDRFVQFREIIVGGLGAHGDAALAVLDPQPGERVLDIGCGFGDSTQQIARLVGDGGSATGVDVSPRFIETSVREAGEARRGEHRLPRPRRRSRRPRRTLRRRLLALRDDVLRGARAGAAQRPRRIEARRKTGDGRVAAAD